MNTKCSINRKTQSYGEGAPLQCCFLLRHAKRTHKKKIQPLTDVEQALPVPQTQSRAEFPVLFSPWLQFCMLLSLVFSLLCRVLCSYLILRATLLVLLPFLVKPDTRANCHPNSNTCDHKFLHLNLNFSSTLEANLEVTHPDC